MNRIVYTLLLIILSVHTGYAQKVVPQHVLDSIAHPKLLQGAGETLKFVSQEMDLGMLSEDDAPRSYSFVYRNVSKKPVSLTRVITSCRCTVAEFVKQPLAPGQEARITLKYNPSEQSGKVYSRAFVFTNLSDTHPTVCLALTGTVNPSADEWRDYTYAMGKLRLKYTTVYFSEVAQQHSPSERIECANSGNRPLKLSALKGTLPAYMQFRTEPEILQAGEKGEIVITLNGKLLPRDKELLHLALIIDGLNLPPSQRTLNVKVNTLSKE